MLYTEINDTLPDLDHGPTTPASCRTPRLDREIGQLDEYP